jgi:hypothetical protein
VRHCGITAHDQLRIFVVSARRKTQVRFREMVHVREMTLAEADLIIEYFHSATPEYLNTLGVDPTRLPVAARWRERFAQVYRQPIDRRDIVLIIRESDGTPIGFSSAD